MRDIFKKFSDRDAFVISNPADIFYFTKFYTVDSLLLLADKPYLITDSRYSVAARQAHDSVVIAPNGYMEQLIALAKEKNLKKLGFQEEHLSAADFLRLEDAGFDLQVIGNFMQEKRSVKSSFEVDQVKRAQSITDKAFEELLPFIKQGVSEKELRARLEYLMFSLSADSLAFETIVASGKNGAKPHAVPSDKKIENGEFITFDFGANCGHYCSDMTRTVALGEISSEQKRIYDAVLKAHNESAAALKPGVKTKDVHDIAVKVLEKEGLDKYFTHSLGHGVGIEIHELPRLSYKSDAVLAPGNIVTIEPGVYIEDFCGVRIENMYLITETGCENLTGTDKNLIKL